jgi:beta-glucosidase
MQTTFILLLLFIAVLYAQSPEQKARVMLAQMTLDEKLVMVHGAKGNVLGNQRLKIPPLNLQDGRQGVSGPQKKQTCYPSALTVASAWDPQLMFKFGASIADEQIEKGVNVLLAPMVNMGRVPMSGRIFESYGEDPHLSSVMVKNFVQGAQSKGIVATTCIFADNTQELNRFSVSANIDERTQWEIYYPAYQAAVEVGTGAMMASYNRINDVHSTENAQALGDLKYRMNYTGWVMSDWGATHSTVPAAKAGLDMQMPDDSFFGAALKEAVLNGTIGADRLDDMVLRTLTSMYRFGLFDRFPVGNLNIDTTSPERTKLARMLAEQSTILLKNNNNILPLKNVKRLAIIGDAGHDFPLVHGGGSGSVEPPYVITPLDAIKQKPALQVAYANGTQKDLALDIAKTADIVIFFASVYSEEGYDRADLKLFGTQDDLIAAVAAVNPKIVVVLDIAGPVRMPWVDSVQAIVCAFLPGQEDGNAIASVLFGDVNPSGKLPITFPVKESDLAINTPRQYPGINGETFYDEKLLIGYRWHDTKAIAPLFPFGHGLSYTSFTYSNLQLSVKRDNKNTFKGLVVTFDVKNTGAVNGSEVAQLYIGYPQAAEEPYQVLRGFAKLNNLSPGQLQSAELQLSEKDVSIWDVSSHDWKVISGTFTLTIGSSSRDQRLHSQFVI